MAVEMRPGGHASNLQLPRVEPTTRRLSGAACGSALCTLLMVGMLACPWTITTAVAQATAVGSEFHVNTYTTNRQRLPAIDVSNGSFVVVWMSYLQDGNRYGVFGQLYDSDGNAVGAEFQANTFTTSHQRHPDVASAANGDFVVVWQGDVQDGDEDGVFGRRFGSDGSALGTEFLVNTYTTGYQTHPAVGAAANGDFVVVWGSFSGSFGQDGSQYAILGQRFASNGSAVGAEFIVNTYTTYNQLLPDVAASPSGDFVVVWNSSQQDGSNIGIFGQRFASGGSAVGTEFQANTYTDYNQVGAAVAVDAAGNFVVVWGSEYQDGFDYGVFGQRFASSGGAVGTEFQVNTYTTYNQSYFVSTDDPPRVAMTSGGDFVVVWSSYYQPGDADSFGVFGQVYASSGTTMGSEFQINTSIESFQGFPAVGADADGIFVVAWTDDYQEGDDGIYGQRFGITPGAEAPTPTPTVPGGVCAAAPLGGCAVPGKSILLIKDKNEDGAGASDKLIWKWLKGPAAMQSDFGDPTSSAAYDFCVYTGTSQTLVMEANVPAGGMCGGAPCWKALSTKGYSRKDAAASTDGIVQLLLKGGDSAKIIVKGKNGSLDLDASTLPLDETANVIVQLSHSDNANCWQASFPSTSIKKNEDSQFKAKTP